MSSPGDKKTCVCFLLQGRREDRPETWTVGLKGDLHPKRSRASKDSGREGLAVINVFEKY